MEKYPYSGAQGARVRRTRAPAQKYIRFTLIALIMSVVQLLPAQGNDDATITSEFKRIFKNIGLNTRNTAMFQDGSFDTLDNDVFELSSQYGKQFQLISFGATWCPPCREELPTLQILSENFAEEQAFAYHMVYVQEDTKIVQSFVDEFKYTFSNLIDESGSIAVGNNVRGIPTTFLVDPYGNIVFHHTGSIDWSQKRIAQAIKNVIATWRSMSES